MSIMFALKGLAKNIGGGVLQIEINFCKTQNGGYNKAHKALFWLINPIPEVGPLTYGLPCTDWLFPTIATWCRIFYPTLEYRYNVGAGLLENGAAPAAGLRVVRSVDFIFLSENKILSLLSLPFVLDMCYGNCSHTLPL